MQPRLIVCATALALAGPALADDSFTLEMPGNPSTGYHWVLDAEASTGLDLVTVADAGYAPPKSDLMGAPVPTRFTVRCLAAGAVRLVFDYTAPDLASVAETRATALTCE